jgi:hypothetical protein
VARLSASSALRHVQSEVTITCEGEIWAADCDLIGYREQNSVCPQCPAHRGAGAKPISRGSRHIGLGQQIQASERPMLGKLKFCACNLCFAPYFDAAR